MTHISDRELIGRWVRDGIVSLLDESELPTSAQDQFVQKITIESCYELADELVDRFDTYDLITDKFPDADDVYDEKFEEKFDMNDQCYREFGRSLEFVETAINHYDEHIHADVSDSELTIPVEGEHWIEFPNNAGANVMMKKIRAIVGGSLWMNLKKDIVYVPESIDQKFTGVLTNEDRKEISEFNQRFTGLRDDEDQIYVQRSLRRND